VGRPDTFDEDYPEWFARLIDDCMIEDGVLRVVTGVWLRLYRPTGKVTYIDVWDGSPAAEGGPYRTPRQWDPNPDDPQPF
jgi:hypothetical protein